MPADKAPSLQQGTSGSGPASLDPLGVDQDVFQHVVAADKVVFPDAKMAFRFGRCHWWRCIDTCSNHIAT